MAKWVCSRENCLSTYLQINKLDERRRLAQGSLTLLEQNRDKVPADHFEKRSKVLKVEATSIQRAIDKLWSRREECIKNGYWPGEIPSLDLDDIFRD